MKKLAKLSPLAGRLRMGLMILLWFGASCSDAHVNLPVTETKSSVTERSEQNPAEGVDPAVHDFGTLTASGQILSHRFVMHNETDFPMRILEAMALMPCCSTISCTSDSVAPRGAIVLEATLRPGFDPGRKQVMFLVKTDAAQESEHNFALRGTFLPEVELVPQNPNIKQLGFGQSAKQVFRIVSRAGRKARGAPRLLQNGAEIKAQLTQFGSELGVDRSPSDPACILEVEILPSWKEGPHSDKVTLLWDGFPEFALPISWSVVPQVVATPCALVLNTEERPSKHRILVTSHDRPIRVLRVRGPLLVGQAEVTGPPSYCQTIQFELDPKLGALVEVTDVRVETDHPEQPFVMVTVLSRGG